VGSNQSGSLVILGIITVFFFLTVTVMGCLYSSWPECRKSDYIGGFFALMHLTAKDEDAAEAYRFLP
jgi:hypothetical protein